MSESIYLDMPKRKSSAHQPSLFHKASIPQMPEGYYSSGPNPNLRRFVEEHAKPYDLETDKYSVKPFDKPITTTKATAIYNMHTYWSKKPHDAIQEYIRHYTQPGDIVLDPMCGSGGTALAALLEGRKAIAIDLSPAATFIAKNYCTPVDIYELQRAYNELERRVAKEMDWLYETRCDRCDGIAKTTYTVYSQVFQCPRCLEKVPLFDCPEIQSQTSAGKIKKIRICPYCVKREHSEEIKSNSKKFGSIPVLVCYECQEGCKPRRDFRKYNDVVKKKSDYFEKFDLGKINEINNKDIPYWYPSIEFPKNFARWNSDLKNLGVDNVSELFTKRNLWALAAYKESIDRIENVDLRHLLSWVLLKCSRMMRYCDDGVGRITSGTYYIPQISRDSHVPSYIEESYGDYVAHHKEKIMQIQNQRELNIVISTQNACNIDLIADETIDYVFTDPPYAGSIQYGELNFVWEAWLGFNTNWYNQEIIVNEARGKTVADWATSMHKSIRELFRVLKPGRWISLCYHDTSEGTWQLVQDIMTEEGLIPDKTDHAVYIDVSQKTLNQLFADKVNKRDLVINFRKPYQGELGGQGNFFNVADIVSFQQEGRWVLVELLTNHPGTTVDRLYDELVSRMVRKGQFERHNFDDLLRSVAEESPLGSGHWYLLATADQIDETESNKETEAANQLETFMQKRLHEHPETLGVHYSDLFEQYLPVKDKPRRLIQDWLPEFFFKTSEGTWRPPVDDVERHQKAELRSSGALRKIKRFANALNDGVPPHDRDKPENAVTLVDWIRQCRRAGLFDLGRVMYEKGGIRFDGLSEESHLLVEEDYQICVGRSEKKIIKRKTKDQQLPLVNN